MSEPLSISYNDGTPLSPEQLQEIKNAELKKLQDAFPLTLTICKNQAIPNGYVIVSEGSSINCPNFPDNTWQIRTPGNTDTVCKVSPIPDNYVITGEGSSISCPNFPNNTYQIART